MEAKGILTVKWRMTLNHVRLRNKMLILYFSSVFVPIVLTNVIFYQVTTENVKNQRMNDISHTVEQIKEDFRNEVDDAVSVSTVFYTDLMLNDILEANYEDAGQYVEAYDSYLRRILNSYGPIYYSMQAITVYVDNPTMLYSGGVGYMTDEVKGEEWYRRLMKAGNSSLPIFYRESKEGQPDKYSIIRRLDYYSSQNEYLKILKIDLKTQQVEQIFTNLNLQGDTYLVNGGGLVEYTTNDEAGDWRMEPLRYEDIPKNPDTIEFDTEPYTTNYLEGWRLVGTISENEVFENVRNSRNFVIYLAIVNIVLPTLIILWITRNLTIRLIRILRHMKKVKNQNFDTINQVETRDEIGQLTEEFNRMTLQIRSLISDVYVADIHRKDLEIQNRKSQLHALQNQINPHFLFNALETIRMRSLMKQETETAKIIQNMAKLFRSSLTWNKDRVKVAEELEFILCFLQIQHYRFGERLIYHIDMDDAVKDCYIPKLVFLPFVENASIHGIEPLKAGGIIDIRIVRAGGQLRFEIQDNGVGMPPEQVELIYSYLKSEEELGDHIGVQNVIYRLKMIYGSGFSFKLESSQERGTFVSIEIPMEDTKL
ncbi:sensor histidine kinase [Paenibacillus sp. HB172176]|uniref:sensor histidine kinase n=1 Tax=Paenibacillus sp. HB172176 TaxID=2493690 RepID=UPI0014396113|nr:sensor histidine kinase [Paenibacillus sp. HB172176]